MTSKNKTTALIFCLATTVVCLVVAVANVHVALSGDTLVVGAPFESSSASGIDGAQDDNSAINAGAAYVFARDAGGIWSQQAYLKASNADSGDEFGFSVALAGDDLVVGAFLMSRKEPAPAPGAHVAIP